MVSFSPQSAGDSQAEEEILFSDLQQRLASDQDWQRDIELGHRVGFYKVKGNLGKGNFSTVKLAIHSLTRETVGLKVVDKTKMEPKMTKMLLREIQVMDLCQHPHLVRLYEVLETRTKLYLVMQYGPGGDLFMKVSQSGRFSEERARGIFTQMCGAVSYLHCRGMVHRDIKAENVFFTVKDRVLLGDFGFATRVDSMEQHLTTFCGSPPYAAPELFVDDHYIGAPVDIWALGILLYFMVTAAMPFNAGTVSMLKNVILEGSFTLPAYLSPDCGLLIKSILKRRPDARLSLEDVARHPWLGGEVSWEGEEAAGYRPHPRLGASLSPVECEVMERLEQLGISVDTLRQETIRGVRSPVIATYRILLHKALTNLGETGTIKTSMTSIKSIKKVPVEVEDYSNNNRKDVKSSSKISRKDQSKFCLIL